MMNAHAGLHPWLEEFYGWPCDDPQQWAVVIRAYLDDSGSDNTDYVIIAGHAGQRRQWEKFCPAWIEAAKPHRRLHMANLRWRGTRHEDLMKRLAPVPAQCGLLPIVGGIRISDYSDLVEGTIIERIACGYAQALHGAIIGFLASLPRHENAWIVLESSLRYDPVAALIFSVISRLDHPKLIDNNGKSKLRGFSIVSKEECPLLDQADVLAFSHYQHRHNEASVKARITAPIRGDAVGIFPNREQARTMATNIVAHSANLTLPSADQYGKFVAALRAGLDNAKV